MNSSNVGSNVGHNGIDFRIRFSRLPTFSVNSISKWRFGGLILDPFTRLICGCFSIYGRQEVVLLFSSSKLFSSCMAIEGISCCFWSSSDSLAFATGSSFSTTYSISRSSMLSSVALFSFCCISWF